MTQPTRVTTLWNTIVTESMTVTLSSEDSEFTVDKAIADDDTSTFARTTSDSEFKSLIINLGATNTAPYDTFAIAGSNLTSAGEFRIGRYGSSPVMETVTMTEDCFVYYWDEIAYDRYIQFQASEVTTEGYYEFPVVWLGQRLELGANPQIPINILDNMNSNRVRTPGGQNLGFQNFYQRGYEMKFIVDFLPPMYNALKEMHDDRGRVKPFFFNLAPQDPNDSVFYARTEVFNFTIDGKDARPGTWKVLEEK